MSQQKEKSLGNKVVLSKIPREEYSRFQQYCNHNGESINAAIRRLILSEIDNPEPVKIAGKSVFVYNKNKDNFSWRVVVDDDDETLIIDDDLPSDSVDHFLESLLQATKERNSQIRKKQPHSISLPSKLKRKRK